MCWRKTNGERRGGGNKMANQNMASMKKRKQHGSAQTGEIMKACFLFREKHGESGVTASARV